MESKATNNMANQIKVIDFLKDVYYDNESQQVLIPNKDMDISILQVRGYSAICAITLTQYEAAIFQDQIGEWIIEAINEKREREINNQ